MNFQMEFFEAKIRCILQDLENLFYDESKKEQYKTKFEELSTDFNLLNSININA